MLYIYVLLHNILYMSKIGKNVCTFRRTKKSRDKNNFCLAMQAVFLSYVNEYSFETNSKLAVYFSNYMEIIYGFLMIQKMFSTIPL